MSVMMMMKNRMCVLYLSSGTRQAGPRMRRGKTIAKKQLTELTGSVVESIRGVWIRTVVPVLVPALVPVLVLHGPWGSWYRYVVWVGGWAEFRQRCSLPPSHCDLLWHDGY